MLRNDPKVIVALDMADAASVFDFVDALSPESCRLKIGKELFTSTGPQLVEQLQKRGFEIFLDLKFHDIPNTVRKAVIAAAKLGVWMVNVHASGGRDMLFAAREAIDMAGVNRPYLIAVSVLTSMSDQSLEETGVNRSVAEQVKGLTRLAIEAGLDGMVCSAQEAADLRHEFGDTPLLVTPGIRPAGTDQDDQKRIMTPRDAIDAGASYLVIGRPVTRHADPSRVLEEINLSLI